jgi:putative ABC transport system ATP-binding protein
MSARPLNIASPAVNGSPPALITLQDVVKTFKNAAGAYTVLKGIRASFYERQFVSIVGRSGSGKSTLLNMMTGIDHPTSGVVRVGDTVLHSMNEGRMSVWRGKQMGIVFQFFQLLPMLSLLENVMLPMDFCDMFAPAERERRAMDLLAMVGLQDLEHHYPAAVSGGQQQSAAVARALANDPPILVADEPTGNLDTKTAERVLEIFEEQVALGKTVLMVTHDNTLANRAQRKLIISDGELVNEALSSAFPSLNHDTLRTLSHAAQPAQYAAGTLLYASGSGPALMLVSAGTLVIEQARVALGSRVGKANVTGQVRAGQVFSQADTRRMGKSLLGLRALEPVQALVVETLPASAEMDAALEAWSARREAANGGHPKGSQ